MNTPEENYEDDAIAIIGEFCRFPGADNVEQFWQNLVQGVESIRFFSDEDLSSAGVPSELFNDPDYVKAQGVLDDIAGFDASFFGLSPSEAEMMDPQHRIFLEGAWTVLERAGYDPEQFDGRIGVFAGSGLNNYLLRSLMTDSNAVMSKGEYLVLMSSDKDFMPTRVSYKLNLKGPSISVSTACSTSLVAVDLACQSLLSFQTDMALAGGISLQVPNISGYLYEEGGTQSPDGHCRAFDEKSGGLVGGSGAGIVVLKRLEDAIADGDSISAIIKGSAVNNDGSLKAGYSSPSIEGQAAVIAEAQANAGVNPDTISYIEAHGTGTKLGDPIEIAALTQAFRGKTDKKNYCRLGSVKTNIGHLDTAAGMAGLIKVALSLKNQKIPKSLHFETPNPDIDFANSPFVVNSELSDWTLGNTPRRAGVSSFGIGGTNAHVVLQEAPARADENAPLRNAELLVLSAKSEAALDQASQNLSTFLQNNADVNIADVAFTLAQGRRGFAYRKSVVCSKASVGAEILKTSNPQTAKRSQSPSVAFMFSGQGAQHVKMGQDLYQSEPVFKAVVDQCAELLEPHLGCDVRTFINPQDGVDGVDGLEVTQTNIAQPLLFTVEYALTKLWASWGVEPVEMIGHSVGEYVAACVAGVFSLEDALQVVAKRGALMQSMAAGDMLGVSLSKSELVSFLTDDLTIAAINSPTRCVVSGAKDAVDDLRKVLAEKDIDCRDLHTSHAFHSPAMDGMLDDFAREMEGISLHAPQIPFVSNLTGKHITDEETTDPKYWVQHLRNCVLFSDGLTTLLNPRKHILLEIGPGRTLCNFARMTTENAGSVLAYPSLRHPQEHHSDVEFILQTLGKLWVAGVDVNWAEIQGDGRRRIALPTYPFEHKRYWLDTSIRSQENPQAMPDNTQRQNLDDWFYVPSWRRLAPLSQDNLGLSEGPVLIFMDDCGLGLKLLEHLKATGQKTVVVHKGKAFEQQSDHNYTVEPSTPENYVALVSALTKQALFPSSIFHLWTVGTEQGNPVEQAESVLDKGFYSLVYLAQSIEAADKNVNIFVVTNNLCDVTGEEQICPEKSTLLGPLRVIPLEHPKLQCKGIDILLDEHQQTVSDACAEQVWAEMSSQTKTTENEVVVALRGWHRWMQRFERNSISKINEAHPPRLRKQGVCMIAGGLSGIGLELAKSLAVTSQAKLALVGATELPPRQDWPAYLARIAKTKKSNDIEAIVGMNIEQWEEQIDQSLGIRPIESYGDFVEQINQLCTLYVYRYFRNSGLNMEKGQRYTTTDLSTHFAVLPKFLKLFTYLVKILDQDAVIAIDGDVIEFLVSPKDMEEPDGLRLKMQADFPAFKSMFAVFEHCMSDYQRALNGEIEAVNVLFPDGTSLWEKSTKDIPEHTRHRVYTQLARDVILELLAKNPDRTLKILEIGAGAGVFTNVLLADLKGKNVEYTFTDIGKSFVLDAERKAKSNGHDFMKFGLLDASKDPAEQGYESQGYDVVIELDAVHATPVMAETMTQIKKLLCPGGILLFVESVATRRWMNLPLGLLEGWWYFEDKDLRQDSPLLSLDTWETLLCTEGFAAKAYPRNPEKRRTADCGLIIAERPMQENDDDRVAEKIRSVLELEHLGADVLVLAADISNKGSLSIAVAQTEDYFGPLNSFIQTAAVENRGPIITKTKNPKHNEFLPKINGTIFVDELLAHKNLDFMMLSSSHSSFDVGLGDVEYCASNSYVDAFVNMKARQNGTPVIAVNWDRWRSIGMAKAYENMVKRRTGELPEGGMSAHEGIEAFQRILSQHPLPPQVIISICDFNEKIARVDLFSSGQTTALVGASDALHARPNLETDYVAVENEIQKDMVQIWQDVLGLKQLGIRDSFYDLGGDSLIAVKVISRVREVFDVEMTVSMLFERPTVEALSERIEVLQWSMQTPPVDFGGEQGVLESEEGTL